MKMIKRLFVSLAVLGIALMCIGAALGEFGKGETRVQAQHSASERRREQLTDALDKGELIRLHIVASDDSDKAQRDKLCVRDALLAAYGDRLSDMEDREHTIEFLRGELDNIETLASSVLAARGAAADVRASMGEREFPYREYEGVSVPAGRYMALHIELGAGQGRNWWCVIYPALCAPVPDMPLPDAGYGATGSAAHEMGDGLSAGDASDVSDASGAGDALVMGNASGDANALNAGDASTSAGAAHASDAPVDEAHAARGGIVFYSAIWDWLRDALGL
ncbi:MAG: stage II sporulation protein R [Candidatus Fimadaptatus sp.]|jgi:stage II sporulation protein R